VHASSLCVCVCFSLYVCKYLKEEGVSEKEAKEKGGREENNYQQLTQQAT